MEAAKEMKFGTKIALGMRMMPKLRTHIAQRKRAIPDSTMKTNHNMMCIVVIALVGCNVTSVLVTEHLLTSPSVLVLALCNQPESFALDLDDDQSHHLWHQRLFTWVISWLFLLVKQPAIPVGRLTFYHGFFSFLFSPSNFRARWTELKLVTCSEVSVIWKHVQNLSYPSPYKLEAQNHLFGRLCNLMATLTAYIFGVKHDINNRASALTTTRGLLHRLKTTWTVVHKWLQTGLTFCPPSVNSGFYFIARLRRRTSANRTQPHLPNSGR